MGNEGVQDDRGASFCLEVRHSAAPPEVQRCGANFDREGDENRVTLCHRRDGPVVVILVVVEEILDVRRQASELSSEAVSGDGSDVEVVRLSVTERGGSRAEHEVKPEREIYIGQRPRVRKIGLRWRKFRD